MTRTLVYLAIAAAAILGTAYLATAQQMDGSNCEWAYKKLQQHRNYGVCQEQGDHARSKDTAEPTGKGEHSIRDRVRDTISRLTD